MDDNYVVEKMNLQEWNEVNRRKTGREASTLSLEAGFPLRYYGSSIQGNRPTQQDAWILEKIPDGICAAVCDGMGGTKGGGAASKKAIQKIQSCLGELREEEILQVFERMVREGDSEICLMTDAEGKSLQGGTTVVCIAAIKSRLYWVSVGDSKLYLLRQGKITCLVEEHNYLNVLNKRLRLGEISQEYYEREKQDGAALISYLGSGGLPEIDLNEKPLALKEGDYILLCSDGIYKSLNEEQMKALLEESGGNPKIAVSRLLRYAMKFGNGRQDNTTAAVLYCGGM